ncbi:MAG: hypothetical protein AB4038_12890 [Prochloraceae cyanobacterium]
MRKTSSTPIPPTASTQALVELIKYYRELVNYHRQSLALAHEKLIQLEVFLSSELPHEIEARISDFPELPTKLKAILESDFDTNGSESTTLTQNLAPNQVELSPAEIAPETEKPKLKPKKTVSPVSTRFDSKFPPSTRMAQHGGTLTGSTAAALQENAGKAMKARDIFDWIYPDGLPDLQRKKISNSIVKILFEGLKRGKWKRVGQGLYVSLKTKEPTVESLEKPATSNRSAKKSSGSKKKKSTVTGKASEVVATKDITKSLEAKNPKAKNKVEVYGNLVEAIVQALKQNTPNKMNVSQILDWIYPEGLSAQESKIVRQKISERLSRYKKYKGWDSVGKGFYVWLGS